MASVTIERKNLNRQQRPTTFLIHLCTEFTSKAVVQNCSIEKSLNIGIAYSKVTRNSRVLLRGALNTKAIEILSQITRIEKKTFPASEVYPFGEELWRKKPNTRVLYVTQTPQGPLIAYALYVRQKGVAFLHKVCVAEAFRQKGVGMQLMKYIRTRLQKEGCQYVHLWVDKGRWSARSLYIRNGFEERELLTDYYAPGRDGIKMVLDLERGI